MADWYDRLISPLGLDAHRLDRLLAGVEQELLALSPSDAWRPLEVSLNRLMDGRRLLVFRGLDSDSGLYRFFPCSHANAEVLDDFLRRAESHLTPAGAPEFPRAGLLDSVLDCLTPAHPVEVMAPLPDEKGEAQIFLDHLFQAFGHAGGLKKAGATLEMRVSKAGSGFSSCRDQGVPNAFGRTSGTLLHSREHHIPMWTS